MVIYYINPCSRVNGPFAIADKNQNHFLCRGDFCIRIKDNNAELLYINKEVTKSLYWEHLVLIDKFQVDIQSMPKANCVLYSVDNIKQRSGNVDVLKYLMNLSHQSVVRNFFYDTINILTYNSDKLDGNIYCELISTILSERKLDEVLALENIPFYDFLSPLAQKFFNEVLPVAKDLRSVFKLVKEKYKDDFIEAINRFRIQYPDRTIYDLNNEHKDSIQNIKVQFDFIYAELINRGYTQVQENIWQDAQGSKFIIDIKKIE